jgi:DNA-binding GntR family transcriptional regulator
MNKALVVDPITTISRKERIVEAIRRAILSGKLRPGHRIVESQMAKQLGVGNTAVREALFELQSRGFVTRVANKGTFVTQLTVDDVEQIFCVRRNLEGLAAELLQGRMTPAILDRLQRCIDGMGPAAVLLDLESFCRLDVEFHTTIWHATGNRFLAAALETMVLPLFAFFNMTCPPDRETLLAGVQQHAELLRAVRDGRNVRECMERAVDYFHTEKLTLLFNIRNGGPGAAGRDVGTPALSG